MTPPAIAPAAVDDEEPVAVVDDRLSLLERSRDRPLILVRELTGITQPREATTIPPGRRLPIYKSLHSARQWATWTIQTRSP